MSRRDIQWSIHGPDSDESVIQEWIQVALRSSPPELAKRESEIKNERLALRQLIKDTNKEAKLGNINPEVAERIKKGAREIMAGESS